MISQQMALFKRSDSIQPADAFGVFGVSQQPGWPDRFGLALRDWSARTLTSPIRTLSLFSGAGGLDVGFHDAGFSIDTMVEIEPRFAETLRANARVGAMYFESEVRCIDIKEFHPVSNDTVDFVIGGPPCQTFSAAGRRAEGVQGTSEDRGLLFEEYVRLVLHFRPRGFLFENVYGLTGAEGGVAWRRIRHAFEEAGYRIFSRILDAADYGVPQHRERLFIVGTKDGEFLFPAPTHGPDSPSGRPHFTAGEAIQGVSLSTEERQVGLRGRYGDLLAGVPPGLNYSFFTERMGHPAPIFAWRSKFSDFLYKADPAAPIRTLKAQGGQYTGPFHWDNRPFAVPELKRLQTFPDDYVVTGGKQAVIHQVGNSVPPQLARVLALSVLEQVFGFEGPCTIPRLSHTFKLGFRRRKRLLTDEYRAKAVFALRESRSSLNGSHSTARRRSFSASLSRDFAWKVPAQGKQAMKVVFAPGKERWDFSIAVRRQRKRAAFAIAIRPARTPWNLPVKEVVLSGSHLEEHVFTGAWKAFEAEVTRRGIKADLVQLRGYYQYRPAIIATMVCASKARVSRRWKVVGFVVAGVGVGQTLSERELATAWALPPRAVLSVCLFLRRLGYEVRNRHTNPQIPKGSFLVPYPFPTLSPQSVQLRKSLVAG